MLTDNGKEFTDRFTRKGERDPTGQHSFDKACKAIKVEHRLTKPRTPQTNGRLERFNGRINDLLQTTRSIHWMRRSSIMNGFTTTVFPRKHWDTKYLFKHSRNGRKRSQIYSKRRYMIYWDLTLT